MNPFFSKRRAEQKFKVMKKFPLCLIAIGMVLTLSGCVAANSQNVSVKNGPEKNATVSKSIRLADFNEISVSQGIIVTYTQGASSVAKVRTTPSAEKYLKITVTDDKLNIRYEGKGKIVGPTYVEVGSRGLNEINLSSNASFKSETLVREGSIEFNISSSGKAEIGRIVAHKVDADVSSSGVYAVKEICCSEDFDVDASSSGSVAATKVVCGKLDAEVTSSAALSINKLTAQSLDVSASSSGAVSVKEAVSQLVKIDASSSAGVKVSGIMATDVKAQASSGAGISLEGKSAAFSKSENSGGSVKANISR